MKKTAEQYDKVMEKCSSLFLKKNKDYGTSWRIMRPSSLTDQMFIKAKRIRSIEEKGTQKINDSISGEYIALINYGLLAIIQLALPEGSPLEMQVQEVEKLYKKYAKETRTLMLEKNHDYGEAWREMRISSITDMMLAKLLRIKQIEDNQGATIASEGLESNYMDIINYAAFVLIRFSEK